MNDMTTDAQSEFVEMFDEACDPHGMPIYSGYAHEAYTKLIRGLYRAQLGADDECFVRVTETDSYVVDTDETPVKLSDCVNTKTEPSVTPSTQLNGDYSTAREIMMRMEPEDLANLIAVVMRDRTDVESIETASTEHDGDTPRMVIRTGQYYIPEITYRERTTPRRLVSIAMNVRTV